MGQNSRLALPVLAMIDGYAGDITDLVILDTYTAVVMEIDYLLDMYTEDITDVNDKQVDNLLDRYTTEATS